MNDLRWTYNAAVKGLIPLELRLMRVGAFCVAELLRNCPTTESDLRSPRSFIEQRNKHIELLEQQNHFSEK